MVTDERTLQQRTQKREREEGKMVPLSAVMDMKVRNLSSRVKAMWDCTLLSSLCPAEFIRFLRFDVVEQAAFVLPVKEDGFTSIEYVEMPEMESRREIRRMNDEGRAYKRNNPGLVSSFCLKMVATCTPLPG